MNIGKMLLFVMMVMILNSCASPSSQEPMSTPSPEPLLPTATARSVVKPGKLVDPASLQYLGAFTMPAGGERPRTFEYGGNAMTFNPDGDPSGLEDGFPGSLFITGHDRMPYGDLPDGSQVAEVSIPAPSLDRDPVLLPRAGFLQDFVDVTRGHFTSMDEIVRIGMLYLNTPATGPQLHLAWGQHFEPVPPAPANGWFSPDLSRPDFTGEWFLSAPWYSVNDYLFEIPADWADAHAEGQRVATGRFRDGGWSGMGPVLIAYRPWDENGNLYPNGASLETTTLLRYADSTETDRIERSLQAYQHPDEWNGGAWLASPSGASAVLFAGAKSNGEKYWYGYINPAGANLPCVDTEITDFITCRLSDGSPCPAEDFNGCPAHNDYRGWWSAHWDTEFIFYDPADLEQVANGDLASWEPQPYAALDIDEQMLFNPAGVEIDMLGAGSQRRYRLGDVAYDRTNGLLYVLELFADGAAPVVHVWLVP